jgi:hypothetical protein
MFNRFFFDAPSNVMMSAITHLFSSFSKRRKFHNTNNRKQKASAVLEMFSLLHHPHSPLLIRDLGRGWQKFTVEIKNNVFQDDTLNSVGARSERSGDNSSI